MIIFTGLVFSMLLVWLSFANKPKTIAMLSGAMAATSVVQFILLERPAVVMLAAVALGYAVISFVNRDFAMKRPVIYSIIGLMTSIWLLINGFPALFTIEILALLGNVGTLTVLMIREPIGVKLVLLMNAGFWLTYQINVGSWGQVPGNVIHIIATVVSLTILLKQSGIFTKIGAPLVFVNNDFHVPLIK